MIKTNKLETSIAHLETDGKILFVIFKEETDMHLENVDEIINARVKMQEGKKMLVFADVRKVWQVSKEARVKAANPEFLNLSIATAIFTESLSSKILANFYIKFNKPPVPTKMFNSKEKAMEWLDTFR